MNRTGEVANRTIGVSFPTRGIGGRLFYRHKFLFPNKRNEKGNLIAFFPKREEWKKSSYRFFSPNEENEKRKLKLKLKEYFQMKGMEVKKKRRALILKVGVISLGLGKINL